MRFIGNYSSGKMGYAIAEELAKKGARVILVSGPVSVSTNNTKIELVKVESAEEMYNTCLNHFPECNGAVMTAAVADFTPAKQDSQKTKRGKKNRTIELIPTRDIAAKLGEMKQHNQLLAGFALETNNELENAGKKLKKKNFDFIVLNSLNEPGAGFGVNTNKITILDRDNNLQNFELKPKAEVATDIVNKLISMMKVDSAG